MSLTIIRDDDINVDFKCFFVNLIFGRRFFIKPRHIFLSLKDDTVKSSILEYMEDVVVDSMNEVLSKHKVYNVVSMKNLYNIIVERTLREFKAGFEHEYYKIEKNRHNEFIMPWEYGENIDEYAPDEYVEYTDGIEYNFAYDLGKKWALTVINYGY